MSRVDKPTTDCLRLQLFESLDARWMAPGILWNPLYKSLSWWQYDDDDDGDDDDDVHN